MEWDCLVDGSSDQNQIGHIELVLLESTTQFDQRIHIQLYAYLINGI